MNFQTINHEETTITELIPGSGMIESERDALDCISACGERDTDLLLIDAACLPEAFFRLRTGLLGAVLQKFANYRIKAAVVAPPDAAKQGKFVDFMLEANRGNQFRVFEGREKAVEWLIGHE